MPSDRFIGMVSVIACTFRIDVQNNHEPTIAQPHNEPDSATNINRFRIDVYNYTPVNVVFALQALRAVLVGFSPAKLPGAQPQFLLELSLTGSKWKSKPDYAKVGLG